MHPECAFSFEDLFRAVWGRGWTEDERDEVYGMTQTDRNEWVSQTARKTDFKTADRVGTDGAIYRAFWRDRGDTSNQESKKEKKG